MSDRLIPCVQTRSKEAKSWCRNECQKIRKEAPFQIDARKGTNVKTILAWNVDMCWENPETLHSPSLTINRISLTVKDQGHGVWDSCKPKRRFAAQDPKWMSEFSWSNPVHWDDACDSEIWLVETQDVSQDISVQREDLRNHLYQHSTASNTKGIINGRLNASWKICSLVVIHQDMCFCKTDSATYQQLQDSTANGDTGLDQGLISNSPYVWLLRNDP